MAVEVVHTLRADGGDYTTASAWNAAEARDLPAAGEIAVLECYNDWPGGLENRLTSNAAWVTDEDHYPWIRSAPGDGTNGPNHHRGVPGAGFVIHHFNEFFATIVFNGGKKVRISGIEVRHTNQSRGRRAIDDDTTGNGWIIEDVIDQSGLGVTAGTGGGWLRNVLHFKTNPGGTLVFGRGGSTPVYNSTFISLAGAAAGMSVNFTSHDLTVYNSVVVGAAIDNNAPGGSGFTGSNNATDHSEATSTLRGTDNVYGVDPETDFVDAANLDYRLTPSSRLRGAGADFSHLFDHDIAGNERGDSWDIGAFQYVDDAPQVEYDPDLDAGLATRSGRAPAGAYGYASRADAGSTIARGVELSLDAQLVSPYVEAVTAGSAAGRGLLLDLRAAIQYAASVLPGVGAGEGVALQLDAGTVSPYDARLAPGSARASGTELDLEAWTAVAYRVDLASGVSSGRGVDLVLVAEEHQEYRATLAPGSSYGAGHLPEACLGLRPVLGRGKAAGAGAVPGLQQGLRAPLARGQASGRGEALSLISGEVSPYAAPVAAGQAIGRGSALAHQAGFSVDALVGRARSAGRQLVATSGLVAGVVIGSARAAGARLAFFTGEALGTIRSTGTRDVSVAYSTRSLAAALSTRPA